jgi:hypothetical protein
MNELQEAYNARMNYTNAQEHVPKIECSIRVIKERFRATFHCLPFLKLPAVMVKILAMESTKKLNFFPPTNGMSPYYSPRMSNHQENLDYAKHCAIPFGTYVQAHTEPMRINTQHLRTLDYIYLRYLSKKQGGHELLDLWTGAMITCQNVSPLPMTQDVIDLVHAMADQDNMPTGLKITTKAGIVLHDTASIAGVYDHSEIYEEEDGFDDEMNPNDIGEILPDKKNTPELTVLENDYYEEAFITTDNNNSHDSDDKDEEVNVTESGSNQDSSDENNGQGDQGNPTPFKTTRFGRVSKPPMKLSLSQYNIPTQGYNNIEYTTTSARVFAITVNQTMNKFQNQYQFIQTYSLNAGLKKFGEKGWDAALGDMKQLHDRRVLKPIDASKLSALDKRRALESLIFLVEKKDNKNKGRTCANGNTQ